MNSWLEDFASTLAFLGRVFGSRIKLLGIIRWNLPCCPNRWKAAWADPVKSIKNE